MAITFQEWAERIDKAAGGRALSAAVLQVLQIAGIEGEAEAKRRATDRKRVRTGRLRSSITHHITTRSNDVVLELRAGGSNVPYARIQELGGTIVPKRAQYLAQPVGKALTPSGVPKYTGPRDPTAPPLAFVESVFGNKLLIDESGDPLFLLLKRVKIKPGRFIEAGANKAQERIERDLPVAIARFLGGE